MLDIRDRRILEELQEDATVAVADLADTVGLSSPPAGVASRRWRITV